MCAPVGHMNNLSNRCGGSDKAEQVPSGHYYLRNSIISLAETTRKARKAARSTTALIHDQQMYSLAYLNDELWEELRKFLAENQIDFCISKTDLPSYLKDDIAAPVSQETERKWQIEKKYLNYWFAKARDGTLEIPDSDGALFIAWKTDGQRIAACYRENWLDK